MLTNKLPKLASYRYVNLLRPKIFCYRNCPAGAVKSSNHLDLGILVNLDESPDKKLVDDVPTKDPDTVFTHTPSNPFELAWDVIEQEALTLANHIQDDEEKPISPRKSENT